MANSISENAKLSALIQTNDFRQIEMIDLTKVNLDFHMREFGYYGTRAVVVKLIEVSLSLLVFNDESVLAILAGLAESQGQGDWKGEEITKLARVLSDPRLYAPQNSKIIASKAAQILVKYGTASQVAIAISTKPSLPPPLAVGSPEVLNLLRSSGYNVSPVIVDNRSLMVYKGTTVDPNLFLDLIGQIFGLIAKNRYITLLLLNIGKDQKSAVLHLCNELGIDPKTLPFNIYFEFYLRTESYAASRSQRPNITSLTPMFETLISIGFKIDKPTRLGTDLASYPEFTSFLIRNQYDVCRRIGSERIGIIFVKNYATQILTDYAVTSDDIIKTFGVMCDGKPEAEEILTYISTLRPVNSPVAGQNIITSIQSTLKELLTKGSKPNQPPVGGIPVAQARLSGGDQALPQIPVTTKQPVQTRQQVLPPRSQIPPPITNKGAQIPVTNAPTSGVGAFVQPNVALAGITRRL